MEIEFKPPEEILPQNLVPLVTGKEKLSIKSVDTQRVWLKERVKQGEEVKASDIAEVNTFSRTETMKDKTREFMEWLKNVSSPINVKTVEHALDIYDELAWDWVYGNELTWEEGFACKQIEKIKTLAVRP